MVDIYFRDNLCNCGKIVCFTKIHFLFVCLKKIVYCTSQKYLEGPNEHTQKNRMVQNVAKIYNNHVFFI